MCHDKKSDQSKSDSGGMGEDMDNHEKMLALHGKSSTRFKSSFSNGSYRWRIYIVANIVFSCSKVLIRGESSLIGRCHARNDSPDDVNKIHA